MDDHDCGLTDTGFCYDVGSEHCSFWCPYHVLIDPKAAPPDEDNWPDPPDIPHSPLISSDDIPF